jgi:ferredoxin/flavodoxin---NADP+ reductase
MFRIVEREQLAPSVHRLRVEAPYVAAKTQPGQFVILIVDEVGERVPFTVSDWDKDAGTVDFVFLEVGRTTRQMASLNAGDTLAHFIGPLGRPTEVDRYGHVVAIASGYGIAAIAPILEALKEKGNRITTILQAAKPESVFGRARLEAASDLLIPAVGEANNGATSLGVLNGLLARNDAEPIDRVVAMASMCVMRAVSEATRPQKIKTMVHLTPIMVDGTGMCGACRLSVEGRNRFACVHGPEFDGHTVDGWEVLLARRCTYADESTLQQGFQCRGCSQW